MLQSAIMIIGCPRSGTTLLFNILSEVPDLWSIGYESKEIIERFHAPSTKNWASGALDADDLTPESKTFILSEFERQVASGEFWRQVNLFRSWLRGNRIYRAIKRSGKSEGNGSSVSSALPQRGLDGIRKFVQTKNIIAPVRKPIRLLEKTPENCLRLPFFEALFPNLKVIYITRDGRANVNSLMEGWRQPHTFPGYQVPGGVHIPGDQRGRWAFSLIPGWRELTSSPLEEVCAWQWIRCNEAVLNFQASSSGKIPFFQIRYEDLVSSPEAVLPTLTEFLDIPYEGVLSPYADALPQINTISRPDPEKWRKQNGKEIEQVLPLMAEMMDRLGYTTD